MKMVKETVNRDGMMIVEEFVEKFREAGLSLMVVQDSSVVYSSKQEGLIPLLDAINSGKPYLVDALVIDKIVGRAAALLLCFGKSKTVIAEIMSEKAVEVLDIHGLEHDCEKLVPCILNKDSTDLCPFERLVERIYDPEEGYRLLSGRLKSAQKK